MKKLQQLYSTLKLPNSLAIFPTRLSTKWFVQECSGNITVCKFNAFVVSLPYTLRRVLVLLTINLCSFKYPVKTRAFLDYLTSSLYWPSVYTSRTYEHKLFNLRH